MTTLVIGDIHIKARQVLPRVEELLDERADISRVVFTGDYCDDWNVRSGVFMNDIEYLASWVENMRDEGYQVDLVFGNHDFQYLLGESGPGTHMELMSFVSSTLFPLDLRIACVVDGYLITHAGLTASWSRHHIDNPKTAEEACKRLNDLLDAGTYAAYDILFLCGAGRGGWDTPGPLWADLYELKDDPSLDIPQIVGHTPVESAHMVSSRGNDLWFCDTFSTYPSGTPIGDGSVLLIENGVVSKVELP